MSFQKTNYHYGILVLNGTFCNHIFHKKYSCYNYCYKCKMISSTNQRNTCVIFLKHILTSKVTDLKLRGLRAKFLKELFILLFCAFENPEPCANVKNLQCNIKNCCSKNSFISKEPNANNKNKKFSLVW